MKTLYFSEKTNKSYESKDACAAAELQWDKEHAAEEARKQKRAADAKKVEDKFAAYEKAKKEAYEALHEFNKEHGAFRTSIEPDNTWWNFFHDFWF